MNCFCPMCGSELKSKDRLAILNNGTIFWKGKKYKFSRHEVDAMMILNNKFGKFVTVDNIAIGMYGGSRNPKDYYQNIRQAMCRIRKKLPASLIISYKFKQGYKLEGFDEGVFGRTDAWDSGVQFSGVPQSDSNVA